MTVTQMMTGRGGWPMTVIMSPEKIPFFAGTYFQGFDDAITTPLCQSMARGS